MNIKGNTGRILVMGDIHGGYKALLQCLERSKFDYENDTLIQLGDVVDRWSQSYECVEELLKIKNLIAIRGNHDWWWNEYIQGGIHPENFKHGARSTLDSYYRNCEKVDGPDYLNDIGIIIPESHRKFFKYQHRYYLDDKKRLFVHGGINRHIPITEQPDQILLWDRDLWKSAVGASIMIESPYKKLKTNGNYSEIFIGHTSTTNWFEDDEKYEGKILVDLSIKPITIPMNKFNIWNIDTGCGSNKGKLTIMDVNTKEYWQSDFTRDLYPNETF